MKHSSFNNNVLNTLTIFCKFGNVETNTNFSKTDPHKSNIPTIEYALKDLGRSINDNRPIQTRHKTYNSTTMAIYRFKISFEDYDDVIREIDIQSNQTFEDLHQALHRATGYNAEQPSSFYVSSDQWIKKDEITYLPSQRKIDAGVALMGKIKLSTLIDDPHQKFYYIYNFDRPLEFHVELIKILLDGELGKEYPYVTRSIGEVPKIVAQAVFPLAPSNTNVDFDFLNDIGFNPADADEIEGMHDMGINAEEDDDDNDEDMDEYSDQEEYDDDDRNDY